MIALKTSLDHAARRTTRRAIAEAAAGRAARPPPAALMTCCMAHKMACITYIYIPYSLLLKTCISSRRRSTSLCCYHSSSEMCGNHAQGAIYNQDLRHTTCGTWGCKCSGPATRIVLQTSSCTHCRTDDSSQGWRQQAAAGAWSLQVCSNQGVRVLHDRSIMMRPSSLFG